jgi:hypothetical protein
MFIDISWSSCVFSFISISNKTYFIVNHDKWFLWRPTFRYLQFHVLLWKQITIKLQSVQIRNYLQEKCEFVSGTADSVKKVQSAEHQFMRCKYLYSWLRCKTKAVNTIAYFVTFWTWGIHPASVRCPVWGSLVGWSSHVKDSVRRSRRSQLRKRKLEDTTKT